MKLARYLAVIVLLAVSMFAYQYWRSTNSGPEAVLAPIMNPTFAEVSPQINQELSLQERTPAGLDDEPGCLPVSSLKGLPELAEDLARLQSVSVRGDTLDAYRSFDEATLRSFADQGDAVAMAVIGSMAVMRAYEEDEALGIDWINRKRLVDDRENSRQRLSPEAGMALNDAAFWFYQSALHGRIFSLQEYGKVRDRLFGGPVGLGWISQADYDSLSNSERKSLAPTVLYEQVAYDIAPNLREGFLAHAMKLSNADEQNSVQQAIRRDIVIEFEATLAESSLPPISVAPTAMPEFQDFVDRICASEKE